MNLILKKNYPRKFNKISGWGKTKAVDVEIINPKTIREIQDIIRNSHPKSIIARGAGRSYGDAAQIKKGKVLKLENFKEIFPNYINNEVTAQAGASFEEILRKIIPRGFFLPVTPGTKKITLGGAIAADVHGKNHHRDGSFGDYVKRVILIDGNGKRITLSPYKEDNLEINELFWATIGGMGLTGIIIEATFSIIPIQTSFIKEETNRFTNLDDLMKEMIRLDDQNKYSVAWIDSMNNNFRGILSRGNHATKQEIKKLKDIDYLSFNPHPFTKIPRFIPINLMNRQFVKIFNEWWFRKTPIKIVKRIITIEKFFYPLDAIENWNNIYGVNGFIQYQIIVPETCRYMIRKVLEKLNHINACSFLPVLKRLGKSNKSYLSFPSKGWTLSIDLPANNQKIDKLLEELDQEIIKVGGKLYLAKDARQSDSTFKKTYKSLDTWQKNKKILDPNCIFISDIANRLKICN